MIQNHLTKAFKAVLLYRQNVTRRARLNNFPLVFEILTVEMLITHQWKMLITHQ